MGDICEGVMGENILFLKHVAEQLGHVLCEGVRVLGVKWWGLIVDIVRVNILRVLGVKW